MGGVSQPPAQEPLPEHHRRRSGRGALALMLAAVLVLGLAIRHVSPSAGTVGSSAAWLRRAEQHLLQWSPVPAEWTRPWLAHGQDNATVCVSGSLCRSCLLSLSLWCCSCATALRLLVCSVLYLLLSTSQSYARMRSCLCA